MKKLFSVLAVLVTLGTANVFASTGIGLQAGGTISNSGFGGVGAVTFKVSSLPCVFAVTVPSFDPFAIGLTADWWIANPKIQQNWGWFYGVGVAAAFYTGDTSVFGLGFRAVVGTNVFLLNKFLELYIDAAWQPMFFIGNGFNAGLLNFPINAGFRFWF